MSRGIRTKFGRAAIPASKPWPQRTGAGAKLDHDYWYCCDRCAMPWPRLELGREEYTGVIVCVNCRDNPNVDNYASEAVRNRYFDLMYRFGVQDF